MKPTRLDSRRRFLRNTTFTALSLATLRSLSLHVLGANNRLVLGVMGTNGRGSALIHGFVARPDVEIGAVCDVDERAIAKGTQAVGDRQSRPPEPYADVRRLLDRPDIDALVIAAPDHWHAPAAILACRAGKHVYVEKPVSHNPQEGEWLVAAARKAGRVVQVGTQRRTMREIVEAIQLVRSGALGRVLFARGWYNNSRGSIGRGKPTPVPSWLNWELWQGPAPEHPFHDNFVHYHWHWFWHWGTGELGNNGVHALDLCRWGLDVGFPRQVCSGGGRYHFDDDQETPDTQVVTFDFGAKAISFEGRSCQKHGIENTMFGVAFYGDQGSLITDGGGYTLYDANAKLVKKVPGSVDDVPHLEDFLNAVRHGQRTAVDAEEGHRSALLCHLGNIAWRTSRTLSCDPASGRILGDRGAMKLWRRAYRPGWNLA